jgi:hypothetical protein
MNDEKFIIEIECSEEDMKNLESVKRIVAHLYQSQKLSQDTFMSFMVFYNNIKSKKQELIDARMIAGGR